MPDRVAEAVLKALFAALEAGKPAGVTLLRNDPLPFEVPAGGLMILLDGEPGEPEVTMSPLRYHYEHRAQLELVVQAGTSASRDAAFDALVQAITVAVADNRTLGGRCDWAEVRAPRAAEIAVEGADSLKAATIDIVLHYATDEAAGFGGNVLEEGDGGQDW